MTSNALTIIALAAVAAIGLWVAAELVEIGYAVLDQVSANLAPLR